MTGAELWTTAAVFGPLLAALVALGGRPWTLKAGLALGSGTALAGSLGLWVEVTRQGPVRHLLGGWGAPLGIELWADGFSVAMLTVTAVVGAAVSLYSLSYFGDLSELDAGASPAGRAARYFAPLWLLLWAALNGIYLSADLFNLYVSLEILGLAAAALVTLAVTPKATVAGMRYLIVSLVGSMLFLLGVALLYTEFGTLSLEELAAAAPAGPMAAASLALMTVGMAAKTALFPLHAWLPPAHAGAPAPASALLSAVVVKGSFFILVRLWFAVYGGASDGGLLLMGGLGAAAILWGSVLALRQRSLKRVIAYSTVAQLGYLFIMFPLLAPEGLGAGGASGPASPEWSDDAWTGGILLALSHALAKAAMFMAAGNMTYAVARDALRDISGVAHRLPMSFLAFGLGGLSLAGLPPSAGFVGKWLLLREAISAGGWFWVAIITIGGLLTIAYVLMVLRHALDLKASSGDFRPVPKRMEWAALLLALAAATLGVRATETFQILLQGGVTPWS
ncbi:MAG: oxidoreductase [Gemmatimonadales bacterium]|nr:MAG: oxidoreductase [Gemmatimonadales bacterium]